MIKKIVLGAVAVGVAVGGPALYYSASKYWKSVRRAIASAADAESENPAEAGAPAGAASPGTAPRLGSEVAPTHALDEVLRFDVTPDWVMRHWPRVSTGLGRLELDGYRVPLVTGPKPSDLAGALTYYFDPRQQVQQITFRGTTGDINNLVQLLTTRYKFARRVTNDPGLILYETVGPDGRAASVARFRPAWVVRASDPHRRFEVDLLLSRPKT